MSRKAIRDMLPIIDPEEDYLTIVTAEEKIARTNAQRKKELEEAHANMKGADNSTFAALSKVLEAARVSSTRPASVPSAKAHAAALNDLDGSRLSLAKSISDMESLLASKEAELAMLKDEARQLEDYDPALEHQNELDGTALRLRMYEGMGFQPALDKDGNVVKMIVRAHSQDMHVVPLDQHKTDFEYSQLLWKLASS
ncbi:hypothetical protein H0H81_007417 [Sphagnurus paluster]|uniref:Kinetochore protein Spc24 n=1 Tax=Sphagnurus paluster TaxID=117069 RepID=A0A9P7KIL8_9AGAR|nr:hypothetical protein H0H81_007417 [Sphagnurus paluster]